MAWLWLISVGTSDVQFPVWQQAAPGTWSQFRIRREKAGLREVHKGLLTLLREDMLIFPDELPEEIPQKQGSSLQFDLKEEGASLQARITAREGAGDSYQISNDGPALPGPSGAPLPLYCPKVAAVLDPARTVFGEEPVSVLVLQTRRHPGAQRARDEPIASGPLVSKFLAEKLSLRWQSGGVLPNSFRLNAGDATWLDILVDKEEFEDVKAQRALVGRLAKGIQGWMPPGGRGRILVTTAGGMPYLKPLFERVPAIWVGQDNTQVLDSPEGRGVPAGVMALDYGKRVLEQETLRFHCAEALRQGDYAGAYGLAGRFPGAGWAGAVRDLLGPLLELPGRPLIIGNRRLAYYALSACQVEVALCLNDAVGALKRLAQFLESSAWALIERDARVRQLRLSVDRDTGRLFGRIPPGHPLLTRLLLRPDKNSTARHSPEGLLIAWPNWLQDPVGGQPNSAGALHELAVRYRTAPPSHPSPPGRRLLKPREYRNRLVHGSRAAIDVGDVAQSLQSVRLIQSMRQGFGENFLALPEVGHLLDGLGYPRFASVVGAELTSLLNSVIRG